MKYTKVTNPPSLLAPPVKWELTDHACRYCLGRVLRRERSSAEVEVRCAECGKTAQGEHTALCCCGADCGTLGQALECIRNPHANEANPQEVMVRERLPEDG
jgi:hypothetical protein